MATFNKIVLVGRLTRDPETRTFANGNKVAKFGFAVGRSRKNQQTGQWENDPNPLFIECEAFTRDTFTRIHDVVMNYCKKGSQILIEGQLRLDSWDDKATGQKRSAHKIAVDEVQLLDGKPQDQDGGPQSQRQAPSSAPRQSNDRPPDDYGSGSQYGEAIPF